jgi:hypothetical protein
MRRISAILAVTLLWCTGCATTVRPEAKPIDPVPVFLTDYGVHSSLMLPTSDGRYVEYSFGDYGYAALNRGGPHNALGALLVSGQAGIGRRYLTVRPGEENPRPAYAPKSFQKLYANRFEVSALVKELDERYRNGKEKPVHNPVNDTVFVKDSEHYSIANNCNHMTARMLRQIGCDVKGDTGTSAFRVVGKQQLPPTSLGRDYADTAPVKPRESSTARRAVSTARAASYTKLDTD